MLFVDWVAGGGFGAEVVCTRTAGANSSLKCWADDRATPPEEAMRETCSIISGDMGALAILEGSIWPMCGSDARRVGQHERQGCAVVESSSTRQRGEAAALRTSSSATALCVLIDVHPTPVLQLLLPSSQLPRHSPASPWRPSRTLSTARSRSSTLVAELPRARRQRSLQRPSSTSSRPSTRRLARPKSLYVHTVTSWSTSVGFVGTGWTAKLSRLLRHCQRCFFAFSHRDTNYKCIGFL